MSTTTNQTELIPIDQRDPASVRAVILARSSDPGAKPEDMKTQIDRCVAFIAKMGWTLVADPNTYAESRTGMHNVAHPKLDAVLKLAIAHAIDVIVCSELDRIDRKEELRYYAIYTAHEYGVDFRFENMPPDGKMPEDIMGKMYMNIMQLFGEIEANRIHERLWPAKQARYEAGLPHGGRAGPLYGYASGERTLGKHGKPMGLISWVIDEDKAYWVRWLFDQVDQAEPGTVSLRRLAKEMQNRAPTSTGEGDWCAKQISNILRNGKYAGLGRSLRWQSERTQQQDADTYMVHDKTKISLRAAAETFPIPVTAIPPIISAEQFARVQDILSHLNDESKRGGSVRGVKRTDGTTLLDGLVRCAHCKGRMTHQWNHRGREEYKCGKRSGMPNHECAPHQIDATRTDTYALKLLAYGLTNPEKMLAIAEAAEQSYTEAGMDAALAASALAHATEQLAKNADEQEHLRDALVALRTVPGMDQQIADIRASQARLMKERVQLQLQADQATPQHSHAIERQEFLRGLFTARDSLINLQTGESTDSGEPYLKIPSTISVEQAASWLGVPVTQVDLNTIVQREMTTGELLGVDVATADVIYSLLRTMPRERLRQMFRQLQITVLVSRPRSRAERALHGNTPLAQRVTLHIGPIEVLLNVANLRRFSYPVRLPSADSACGT
ncbi:MAG: recombinase family protein [Ktedonobacterales bacterium]